MFKKFSTKNLRPDAPLYHQDHARPISRRDFIRQGFMTGSATVLGGSFLGLLSDPAMANHPLTAELETLATEIGCSLGGTGGSNVPFIAFDLAGGANIAGSNVLVGQGGGQMDRLTTGGYSKLGIPGDMTPGLDSTGFTLLQSLASVPSTTARTDFVNDDLKLLFHADSAMLMGILDKTSLTTRANVDGTIIAARSDNDTGNNPHNPLYALAMAGASGQVVDLIGSRNSESGGNSMSPAAFINPAVRPTKVDQPNDVTGMVDVSGLTTILGPDDVSAVMESIARVSHQKLKLGSIDTGLTNDSVVKELVRCGYLKTASLTKHFAGEIVDPELDPIIQNIFGITTGQQIADRELRKTASVMKMVLNGYAGAGCVTMGGYDYHTGDRTTGENRDLRAGRCIGACLEYAQRLAKPLMIYVYSDGSVASNGAPDNSANSGAGDNINLGGRGKGNWTGDNSSTASSMILVYSPSGPTLSSNGLSAELHRQIGRYSGDASVVTSSSPAANNPNLLVNMLLLNYMAVNGDISPGSTTAYTNLFTNNGLSHGLGSVLDNYIAFGTL